jgi:hypothetical protein
MTRLVPLALLVALALTGCSAAAEGGDHSAPAETELADTGHGEESADGHADEAAAEGGHGEEAGPPVMPEDFPVDDVPLIEGDLTKGAVGGGIFTVGISSKDLTADLAHAIELLTGAGFTPRLTEALYSDLETEAFLVRVYANADDESITYLVTSRLAPVVEEPAEDSHGEDSGGH